MLCVKCFEEYRMVKISKHDEMKHRTSSTLVSWTSEVFWTYANDIDDTIDGL